MAYQSFFSPGGGSTTATAAPKGGGYQSFFGFNTPKTGSIAANQAAQPKVQPQKVAPIPKSTSLFSKVVSGAKSLANAATTSEQTVAKGVARVLPGGMNDINQEANQATQANQVVAQTIADKKAGKINQTQATKLINNQAGNSQTAQQTQAKTIKALPTTGQVAAGFAGTAADILTAGNADKIKGGAKIGLTSGKKVLSIFGESKKAKVAEGVVQAAGNATAGGLNSASGGGSKKDIINNAKAGAVFPEVLHYGGKAVVKGTGAVLDKSGIPATRDLIKNVKTSSLLDKVRSSTPEPPPVTKIPVNSIPETELAKVDPAKLAAESQATEPVATQPPAKPSAVPSANDNAVATIQQHMADNYTPASSHPDETFAADHLQNNTDKALKAYQARTTKVFGSKNIVGGDDAKYAVPGMDASKSVNYHEPSSEFAKGYYKHLLTDPDTTHKPVMITAGGTGAGKTSALKKYFVDNGGDVNDYAAIVDTNLTTLKSATERIEPALATGHDVHVNFVYRDPIEAYENGVIPRAAKEGRAVTAGAHAETHAGSLAAIKQVAEKYKDNPKVHIEIHDNSRGAGNSKVVNLDFLKDKSYTKSEIEAKIHSLLDTQLQEGKLTNEQHTIFKGEDKPVTTKPTTATKSEAGASNAVGEKGHDNGTVEPPGKSETERQPEQERPSRGVSEQKANTGTSKVAERIAKDIKGQYGELAQYDKLTIKDQAEKAAALISDKDRLNRVISGEEKLPDGLRATSIITAVRSDPALLKDGELLRKLASSPLASESSYSAQELRLARENAKNDPVEAIKSIQKARIKAFEAKGKVSAPKAITKEVQAIRAAKPKITVKSWDDFIDSLKC